MTDFLILSNSVQERKYFDSGDYALSKAGKAPDHGVTSIGTEHPRAGNIPHTSPLTNTLSRGDSMSAGSPSNTPSTLATSPDGQPVFPPAGIHRGSINGLPGGGLPGAQSRSPVKESSYLARTSSVEDSDMAEAEKAQENAGGTESEGTVSPPPKKEAIPIRKS